MVMATSLRTTPFSQEGSISILKSGQDLVVAGYASVEMVDKQGDLITRNALKDAFGGFMKAEDFRNVQLAHSNIQVGSVIDSYTDSSGRLWKSGVDDAGLFVVIKLRDDIEKAREVANEIRKGALRGFSIGGQAFKRVNKSDAQHGDYTEISKLELHEVTICEKGINPEATFRILKEDTNMTEDTTMNELSSVLDRINMRLDGMEKGEKGVNPFAAMNDNDNEDENDEDKPSKDKPKDEEMAEDGKKNASYGGEDMQAKSEYSDVISSDYLHWMENTLKSGGVDTANARQHFDNLEKAQLGGFDNPSSVDGADYFAGQVKGRAQEGGNPSTGAISALNSGSKADVAKGYLHPADLTSSQVEMAYEAYKAASIEKQLKSSLGTVFADRLAKEQTHEVESRRAQDFDARQPLASIEKAIASLSSRIDSLGSAEGASIRKSEAAPSINVPSTEDLANMSWDEVHSLAGKAFE